MFLGNPSTISCHFFMIVEVNYISGYHPIKMLFGQNPPTYVGTIGFLLDPEKGLGVSSINFPEHRQSQHHSQSFLE